MQTQETPQQTIERLKRELADAKANAKPAPRGELSISPKGCVMFKPAGHKGWPITLYAAQWQAIFERQDEIKAFIKNNVAGAVQ